MRDDSEILGCLKGLGHELDCSLDAVKDITGKCALCGEARQQNSSDTCTQTDKKEGLNGWKVR